MKKAKQQKGITLVALVITIIILIILAGIAIASLTNTGLFGRAQEAKNLTENAQKQEKATLNDYSEAINEAIGEKPKEEESLKNVDKSKTDPESAMPSGVKEVIENDATKGIVIKDSKDNEWVWIEVPKNITADKTEDSDIETALQEYATTYRKGNYLQSYSWTDEWYAFLDDGTLVTSSTEGLTGTQKALNNGCGLTYYEYNTAKHNMLQSIKTNGGFWISRYEAGIENTNTDTTNEEISPVRYSHPDDEITDDTILTFPKAVSQANKIPYNYVYCREAQTLASKMSTDTSKTSSLLFGIQWDLVCKYLEVNAFNGTITPIHNVSETWGNYSNSSLTLKKANSRYCTSPDSSSGKWSLYSKTGNFVRLIDTLYKTNNNKRNYGLLTTGASEDANKMNIYDFAGNVFEWTLEKTSYSGPTCAMRGGGYKDEGDIFAASTRVQYSATTSLHDIGFRSALY